MVGNLKDLVDVPIPTTQVGQYPKPSWYKYAIGDRDFSLLTAKQEFLETYTDAARAIIMDHELPGLDIVTDGGLRFDKTGVASWSTNNLCYFEGVSRVRFSFEGRTVIESIITSEVAKVASEVSGGVYPGSRYPWRRWVIEDELDVGNLRNWVETFKIAQSLTKKPLKFSGPSAAMAAVFSVNKSSKSDRDVYFDLFRVQNRVLRELVQAGCKIIQLDYPFGLAHWAANKVKIKEEIWQDLIDAANEEIKGVNAHIWYHFCFGAPVLWGPDAPPMKFQITETYRHMGGSKVDLLQSEAANTKGEYLDRELAQWKESCPDKEIAIGAATPYNGLETLEDVDRIVEKALKYVPPEKLCITTDEGLAAHGNANRQNALNKLKLIVMSVEKARKKL